MHVRAGIQIVSITGTARKMEQSIGSFFKIPKKLLNSHQIELMWTTEFGKNFMVLVLLKYFIYR